MSEDAALQIATTSTRSMQRGMMTAAKLVQKGECAIFPDGGTEPVKLDEMVYDYIRADGQKMEVWQAHFITGHGFYVLLEADKGPHIEPSSERI